MGRFLKKCSTEYFVIVIVIEIVNRTKVMIAGSREQICVVHDLYEITSCYLCNNMLFWNAPRVSQNSSFWEHLFQKTRPKIAPCCLTSVKSQFFYASARGSFIDYVPFSNHLINLEFLKSSFFHLINGQYNSQKYFRTPPIPKRSLFKK